MLLFLLVATSFSLNLSSFSVARGGSLLYTSSVLRDGGLVSWSGAKGVWKLGDFAGVFDGSWSVFENAADAVSNVPPFPGTFKNASEWAILTLNDQAMDTRNVAHTSWDQTLRDTILVFELLMNNVTWRDPAPSVFGASAIRQVTLVKGGLKFCLFSNFSGFRLLVENGKPVRQVGALDNVWVSIINGVVNSSFFGMESFPIYSPSETEFVSVEFGERVVHTIPLSKLSSGSPQRLNVLVGLLMTKMNDVVWKDESDLEHYITDHGQIAAIASASVLGVLTLVGIVAVAIRLNKRMIPRKATPKELLDNAVMLYLDEESPVDESF